MKDVLPFLVGPGWFQGAAGALWVLQLATERYYTLALWMGSDYYLVWFGLAEIVISREQSAGAGTEMVGIIPRTWMCGCGNTKQGGQGFCHAGAA